MDSLKFKFIPLKKYSKSYAYVWIFLGIVNILLQIPKFLFAYNRTIESNTVLPIYDYDFIMLVLWLILGSFFIVQGVLIYITSKNARNYHNQYYLKEEHEKSSNTFCRRCGITISNEIFKQSKRELIRPTTLLGIKGYFCKRCFKKYFKSQLFYL